MTRARRPADGSSARSGSGSARRGVRSAALIGTYVPRRCGIATFSHDLVQGIRSAGDVQVGVVALNDRAEGYRYPGDVVFEIQQNDVRDYRIAADYLNANRIDVACVQHEYGIFGGRDGYHIVNLLGRLRMPVVTTLHTVRQSPTDAQRRVLQDLAACSDRLVVMSDTARSFLAAIYGIGKEKIELVPHGIPDMPFVDPAFHKDRFGIEGKTALLTFGLLSPNKGIEHVVRALPRVIAAHPDTVYIVLGATHPHVRQREGEAYRLSLEALAREHGVDDRVVFQDRFVDLGELCEFLGAADVYLTPYLNEEQIVSGTLVYAMGAGKAVISTPYWYAKEMLDGDRGRLVPFADSDALASAIIDLLGDDTGRNAMRKRAYAFSRDCVWSAVGERYLEIFRAVRRERAVRPHPFQATTVRDEVAILPEINLAHLRRLTDDVGILQHATYHVPNRRHGYCTDDNARALLLVTSLRPFVTDTSVPDRLSTVYLGFLLHAFDPERRVVRNLLGYDRRWLEEAATPDSLGRAVWALGVTVAHAIDPRLRALAAGLLREIVPALGELPDLRAVSTAILGLEAYLGAVAGDTVARRMRDLLAGRLQSAFLACAGDADWPWPEPKLAYDNARLPHALLEAGRALDSPETVEHALASLAWLARIQTDDGKFSPVGNRGWYHRTQSKARFDQQPIEADGMVAACAAAYRATHDSAWIERAIAAFEWFLGRNDVGQPLWDESTGGCRDGLHPTGASENQGAESTLAWLSALVEIQALQASGDLGWTRGTARARARHASAVPR